MAYKRKPVTSAHTIDLAANPPKISLKDSAVLTPDGKVKHGRYGELPSEIVDQGTVPLEYLALLHPAAEGTAAVRQITKGSAEKGTVLIYAAGEPHAFSAAQLASSEGHAVMAVVSGNQSGNDEFVDSVKAMISEPGTAVPEEYALVKGVFQDLVQKTVEGEDMDTYFSAADADSFVNDFMENALAYGEKYPDGIPAAVDPEEYTFRGKEKDRKYFNENMTAYLSQFPQGAPPLDPAVLKANFTKEQYAVFRNKFHKQTTAIITGDKENKIENFSPPDIVKSMSEVPESVDDLLVKQKSVDGGEFTPYEFSMLHNNLGSGMGVEKGGPVLGAIIGVTPELKTAAEAVEKAGKSLKAKAEALQFLTESEKNAYAAARSVAHTAKLAGKPVVVVGGQLPGLESAEPSAEDVQAALSAMDIDDDGNSSLNYFLQLYRASDYAVYEDYAIHRATEPLAGPRQIIVTK